MLIYHCVGRGSGLELDLPVDRFDEQMTWLAAERRVVSLDQALDALAEPELPERDPIVVTTPALARMINHPAIRRRSGCVTTSSASRVVKPQLLNAENA